MILPFHFDFALRHPRHGELDGGEHVLHEDAVAARGVVDEDVRHGTDDLAVPDQR